MNDPAHDAPLHLCDNPQGPYCLSQVNSSEFMIVVVHGYARLKFKLGGAYVVVSDENSSGFVMSPLDPGSEEVS